MKERLAIPLAIGILSSKQRSTVTQDDVVLCPYRKETHFYQYASRDGHSIETFLPCVQQKCALYDKQCNKCGLISKNLYSLE